MCNKSGVQGWQSLRNFSKMFSRFGLPISTTKKIDFQMFQSLQEATCIERKMCQMCQLVPKKRHLLKEVDLFVNPLPPPRSQRWSACWFLSSLKPIMSKPPWAPSLKKMSCRPAWEQKPWFHSECPCETPAADRQTTLAMVGHWLGRICSSNAVQNQLSGLPSST